MITHKKVLKQYSFNMQIKMPEHRKSEYNCDISQTMVNARHKIFFLLFVKLMFYIQNNIINKKNESFQFFYIMIRKLDCQTKFLPCLTMLCLLFWKKRIYSQLHKNG